MEIFDEGDHLIIVVELPDADEGEINVEVHGKSLSISAGKIHENFNLPCSVESIIKESYNNGLLKLKLTKGS